MLLSNKKRKNGVFVRGWLPFYKILSDAGQCSFLMYRVKGFITLPINVVEIL
jgi:hypothetical protein